MAPVQLNHSPHCVPYRIIILLGNLLPPEGSKLPRSVSAKQVELEGQAEKQNREGTKQNRKIFFFDITYDESQAKLKKHQGKIIIPFFCCYTYLACFSG